VQTVVKRRFSKIKGHLSTAFMFAADRGIEPLPIPKLTNIGSYKKFLFGQVCWMGWSAHQKEIS